MYVVTQSAGVTLTLDRTPIGYRVHCWFSAREADPVAPPRSLLDRTFPTAHEAATAFAVEVERLVEPTPTAFTAHRSSR
jgi:hypothetical protein